MNSKPSVHRLATATPISLVVAGLVFMALGLWLAFDVRIYASPIKPESGAQTALFLVLWLGGGMAIYDFLFVKSYRLPSTGLLHGAPRYNRRQTGTKLLGLAVTFACMGFLYWLFPLYRQPFYQPFFQAVNAVLPSLLLAAVPYFYWLDARQKPETNPEEPVNAYWLLGACLIDILKLRDLSRAYSPHAKESLKQHALGWAVKFFFLPLMFGFIVLNVQAFWGWNTNFATYSWVRWVELISFALFSVDVVWGCAGYLWSLKLLDTHVRSTDATMLGWVVALTFYEPFNYAMGPNFFRYETDMKWHHWLAQTPMLAYFWGGLIIMTAFVFVWSTVIFGLRFSNLTNRGIITSGPYRFMRHPAYVSKSLNWWLVAMPFMVQSSWIEAMRLCLLLLLVNAFYYLRARTEERHLSSDHEYQQYKKWVKL
jgi:protein-S-isoprenylcysteine O-methyltransferase Ste14